MTAEKILIVDDKRTHKTLQSLRLSYRDRFDKAIQAIFRCTPSGKFIDVNSTFADLLGYKSPKELLDSSREAKRYFVRPQRHRELLKALKNSGFVKDFEFEAYRKDGTKVWLSQTTCTVNGCGREEAYYEGIVRNIAEQVAAEKTLKSLLFRQTALLAAIPDIVMEVDINKVYTWANKAGFEFFGDDVLGKEAAAYFEGDQNAYNAVGPLWKGDDHTIYVESWQRRKDGQKRLLVWRYHVLRDYQGKVIGALSSARDITDERLGEDALRQNEERLRQITEHIDEVFWISDLGHNLTFVSPAFERIWGFSREDLYKSSESFRKAIHPEDREGVIAASDLQKNCHPIELEYRIIRPDGSIRHILDRGFPITDETGQARRYIGVAQDVTAWRTTEDALRESKNYLNQIINCIGDPIFVKNHHHRHVLVNQAMCSWTGKQREEMLGKTAHELFPKAEMDPLLEQEKLLFETGEECVTEDQITDLDGNKRTVLTRKSLLSDAKGNKQIVGIVRDITDRKRMEEELRESEEKYRMLFEHSLQGRAVIQDGRIVVCNNAFAAISGYSVAELLSFTDAKALLHPDDQALVLGRYQDTLAGKEVPRHYEHRIVKKDGSVRWVEIYVTTTEHKRKPAVHIVNIDITDRKLAESALRESEERFRLIAETIDEVFWMQDVENGRTIYISPAHERIRGYSRQSIYENLKSFYDHIHPDDRERVAKAFAITKTGRPLDCEYRSIRPDGAVRQIWDRGFPVRDEDGRIRRYVGVAQDVTDWRRAQQALVDSTEYLEQIINRIGDPVFVKDSQYRFVLVNDAMCAFAGRQSQELLGKTVHQLLPKKQADSIWKQESSVFETGLESVTEEEVTDKQGNTRTAIPRVTLLKNKTGKMELVGIIKDITERKRLEAELRQAQKMEAIGALAAGIAHEINTPMQYVRDNTRFLQDAFADLLKVLEAYDRFFQANRNGNAHSALATDVEAAIANAEMEYLIAETPKAISQSLEGLNRVATIVRAMKEFSHPGGEEKKTIDLNHAIENTVTVCRNEWKYVAEMALDFDPTLPLVPCLPGDINQVLLNLIVNAAHAIADAMDGGEKRKGTISISTRHDGDWAEIRIGDTGTGIPEKHKAKIFTPFFTTKEVGKGTGQGLAISHSIIVGKHSGTINFETETGKGTVFTIRLPLRSGSIN
jgi:two-component system NtrC family sensor kinase